MNLRYAETAPSRPVLRWHGGKWLLAPWIIAHMPAHRIYVEPYGGAGSVLMRKARAHAEVYNDLDGEVVNLFRMLRTRGVDLERALRLTPFAREEFSGSCNPCDDPIEQARRTVVRSFMGFGSNAHNRSTGFRSNSNRSGTTPAQDWQSYPDALAAMIERLRGVVIEQRAALEVMAAHDSPETLHYVDPPYVPGTRDTGSDYRHEMTDEDHQVLTNFLHGLRGMVLLSGYRCPLYDAMFSEWVRVDRQAHADGARKRTESLWLNPAAAECQAQRRLFR